MSNILTAPTLGKLIDKLEAELREDPGVVDPERDPVLTHYVLTKHHHDGTLISYRFEPLPDESFVMTSVTYHGRPKVSVRVNAESKEDVERLKSLTGETVRSALKKVFSERLPEECKPNIVVGGG